MATKIQFRRGNAAAVPSLDIAEPGWDIDVNTMTLGDGTSAPPRIPTTKSTGSFNFSGVTFFQVPQLILGLGLASGVSLYFSPTDPTTGLYSPGTGQVAIATGGVNRLVVSSTGVAVTGNVTLSPGGLVDTVDVSLLNPTGVQGIMCKTADNTYAFRKLVPGPGLAAFTNNLGAANAAGAAGDIIISLSPNPQVPGQGGMQVPAGTTGNQSLIAPANGYFRYNTTGNYFEGYIDGQWRTLVDYVEGHTVLVPSQFPSIQDAINYYATRASNTAVTIQLAAGTYSIAAPLTPGGQTSHINVVGANTIDVLMDGTTPVLAVTGTPGNWLVQYKLAGPIPAGITTDHSIFVSTIYGSGDVPSLVWSDAYQVSVPNSNLSAVQIAAGSYPISNMYAPNDYILYSPGSGPPQLRLVSSIINATSMAVSTPFTQATNIGGIGYHRRLSRYTGTMSASNSTSLVGVGTQFQTEMNVGDVIMTAGTNQFARVVSIQSQTAATLASAISFSAEIAVRFSHASMHQGCWKISAIDTIGQTITVVNTSYSTTPPPIHGISFGTVTFSPSALLFTSTICFDVAAEQYIGLSNLIARYTGTSPSAYNYFVYSVNGEVDFFNKVGSVNAGVVINDGSDCNGNALWVSGIQSTALAGFVCENGSSAQFTYLICNGNNSPGIYASSATLNCYNSCASGNAHAGVVATSSTVNLGRVGNFNFNYGGITADQSSIITMTCGQIDCNTSNGCNLSHNSTLTFNSLGTCNGNSNVGLQGTNRSSIDMNGAIVCANYYGATAQTACALYNSRSGNLMQNNFTGILSQEGSTVNFDNSIITYCYGYGCSAWQCSNANFYLCTIKANGVGGIADTYAYSSSVIRVTSSTGSTGANLYKSTPPINVAAANANSYVFTS